MEKMPVQIQEKRIPWSLRLRRPHRKMLKEGAKASKATDTALVEWLIEQQSKKPETPPAFEDRPPRRAPDRKMWALRLSETHDLKLRLAAKVCRMNRSELLEWSIELYHRQHIRSTK